MFHGRAGGDGGRDRFLDESAELSALGSRHRVVLHHRAGKTRGAQREGVRPSDGLALHERDLQAATAQVERDPRLIGQCDARADARHRALDLLVPTQDADRHAERPAERLGQPRLIGGVAERGGRHGPDRLRPCPLRDVAEPRDGVQRPVEQIVGHPAARGDLGTQVEDHPIAQDVRERTLRRRIGDEQLERRAAEVEDGAPHAATPSDPAAAGRTARRPGARRRARGPRSSPSSSRTSR